VQAFRPKQVFPCTVDENKWNESVSMESLFGHLCSGRQFVHDRNIRDARGELLEQESKRIQYTIMRDTRQQLQAMGSKVHFSIGPLPQDIDQVLDDPSRDSYQTTAASTTTNSQPTSQEYNEQASYTRSVQIDQQSKSTAESESQESISELVIGSQETDVNSEARSNRLRAYQAARAGTFDAWNEISIVSAGDNHAEEEVEL
jgi:DNA cross-link repair 1C protein